MRIQQLDQQTNKKPQAFGKLVDPNPQTVEKILNDVFRGNEPLLGQLEKDTLSLLRKEQETANKVDISLDLAGGGYDPVSTVVNIVKKTTGDILAQLKLDNYMKTQSGEAGLKKMLFDGNELAKLKEKELSA